MKKVFLIFRFGGQPIDSFSSGTSADSIPPLPPLPTTTSSAFPMRPGVISSIENRFSASFLASSAKPDLASRLLQNKHKTLTRAHSDSTAVYGRSQFTTDRDSQLIGVTSEHHLGPQCVIKRKINFESDDAFIKTFQLGCPPCFRLSFTEGVAKANNAINFRLRTPYFQLYWYVDAAKGCLESPILSANNKPWVCKICQNIPCQKSAQKNQKKNAKKVHPDLATTYQQPD